MTMPDKIDATFTLSGSADNKGNSHAITKMMTTKFPLCAILMELAAQMQDKELNLQLHWVPRDQNTEADELSNFNASRFDPALEYRSILASFLFAC